MLDERIWFTVQSTLKWATIASFVMAPVLLFVFHLPDEALVFGSLGVMCFIGYCVWDVLGRILP